MKKIYTKISFLLLLIMPLIYGCEKQELLMSKDKVAKQLSHTWTRLFTPAETNITWKFEEGHVYVHQNDNLVTQGTYSIDCSVTKVKVKMEGFDAGYNFLNVTWQVISLDDEGLVITDLDKGNLEYEFVRKD